MAKKDSNVSVRQLARMIKEVMPVFSLAECSKAAKRILFLTANPHKNPLRAKAKAAGLL